MLIFSSTECFFGGVLFCGGRESKSFSAGLWGLYFHPAPCWLVVSGAVFSVWASLFFWGISTGLCMGNCCSGLTFFLYKRNPCIPENTLNEGSNIKFAQETVTLISQTLLEREELRLFAVPSPLPPFPSAAVWNTLIFKAWSGFEANRLKAPSSICTLEHLHS